jgi:carbamate kinase
MQSGLLVLESSAYEKQTGLKQMQLDVIDAETEGMIGYLLEQELQKFVRPDRGMATILSQILVDPKDPAFQNPTKFIGPIMEKIEAEKMGLPVKPDGDHYRRVVPSPQPLKVLDHEMKALQLLTDSNAVVICAGGGGIPVVQNPDGSLTGIEAVIDKDRAACMVGAALKADGLLILTDVPGVFTDFKSPHERFIKHVSQTALAKLSKHFPAGSMGPKCERCVFERRLFVIILTRIPLLIAMLTTYLCSAIEFVNLTGGWAAIGSLNEADKIVDGIAGTRIVQGPDNHIEYSNDDTAEYHPRAA